MAAEQIARARRSFGLIIVAQLNWERFAAMSEWPADILHAVWWLISVIFWPYPWIVLSLAAALIAAGIALWLFAGARLTGRERP